VKKTSVTFLILLLAVGPVSAQNTTSPQGGAAIYTKAAVCASSTTGFTGAQNFQPCVDTAKNGHWFTVMKASLKTSTNKSLFINPSLITGLYTNTQTKGGSGSQTATAIASVAVRVLLDCANCASSGEAQVGAASFALAGQPDSGGSGIVYDARIQQLNTTLGQAITDSCLTFADGVLTNTCEPELIDLILATSSAHSFNFIMTQVGAGVHTITVQARLDTGNVCYNNSGAVTTCSSTAVVNTTLASSVSAALFGLGSLTVVPVQLAPGFSF